MSRRSAMLTARDTLDISVESSLERARADRFHEPVLVGDRAAGDFGRGGGSLDRGHEQPWAGLAEAPPGRRLELLKRRRLLDVREPRPPADRREVRDPGGRRRLAARRLVRSG